MWQRCVPQTDSERTSRTVFKSYPPGRLENSRSNGLRIWQRPFFASFSHKTQNIVHFPLEFWIFTHYLVVAKKTSGTVSAQLA
jgi:hypothetical protein